MLLFAFFTEIGIPKTGLSATITVWEDDGTVAVNAQAMTEIAGGWYKYDFAGYDEEVDYCIRADGSAVLGDADRYKYSSNASDMRAEIVTALFAKTGITAGGSASYNDVVKAVYSIARGKITKSGDAYTFYDDDDVTALFTLTITASQRATS